jgi:hypothetical protein
VQLETRKTQNRVALAGGRLKRLNIRGGRIVVPQNFKLWFEVETQLLFVIRDLKREDQFRFLRMQPIEAERVANYGEYSKEREDQW